MKSQIILIVFICGAVVHCSTIKSLISRRSAVSDSSTGLGIYNGSKTTIKDHPNLGALIVNGKYFCQVTIVSAEHVITIGECIKGYPPSQLSVVVSSEDGLTGITYKVDKVIVHPNYTEEFDYNFGILKIIGKFKWSDKVKAITLPKKAAKPNTNMVVAGWGSTSSVDADDEPNNTFLQGNMKWLDKKKCKTLYEQFGVAFTDRMGCTYNKGKTTLCSGDWADAFISEGVLHAMFQAGATGWCSSEAMPLLVADTLPVVEWIKKTIGAKFEDE